jgi:hypothetical protein
VWELAFALDKDRADGTSSYKPYCASEAKACYQSDWASPSYPNSDQNALNKIDDWLGRGWWGNFTSAHHGGQCFFFAHDIIYRATRGYLRVPSTTAGLYALGTSNRAAWRPGDILQYSSGSSHTAIIYRINSTDGSGKATSVDVIDSNWVTTETIGRHTLKAGTGGKWDLASHWRAISYSKLPKLYTRDPAGPTVGHRTPHRLTGAWEQADVRPTPRRSKSRQ